MLFFVLAVSIPVDAASPENFLRNFGAPPEIAEKMLSGSAPCRECVVAKNYAICVRGKSYPNVSNNAVARQAVLQGEGIAVRRDLYSSLAGRIKAKNPLNVQAAGQALAENPNSGKLIGLEFITFCRGNWCGAMAAAPLPQAEHALPHIYKERSFINQYCNTLLPRARELMAHNRSAEALDVLKEMHDLEFADIDAYLLATRAFIQEKQPVEAAKIARELLEDFAKKMDANQAEELGDMLLDMNLTKEAEHAYKLASSRLRNIP